jgi:glutamate--cysteine ligase
MSSNTMKLLAERIHLNRSALSEWYSKKARISPPPFYCSIDLRDSGHKIVPVDSNLYPAGFNNICPEDLRNAPPILRAQLDTITENSKPKPIEKILILPESHTQNSHYIENLFYLSQIVQNAGFEVRIGWIGTLPEGQSGPIVLRTFSGKELKSYPIHIEDQILSVEGFTPDLILLNNDFSSGYPKILDTVQQRIVPSHRLGWHSRKKSDHFKHYNQLAAEFAEILKIDPWLIQIDTIEIEPVNFNEEEGTEKVAQAAEKLLERTQKAYDFHGIKQKPFVFIKNNSGTYGMGIMVAHSADELRKMNRRTKNKMSVGKNHSLIKSVVVQEGVPTATLVDRLAAEPVIYLMGCQLIGGFLRTNTEKGTEDNLNSQGMVFKKLCMSDLQSGDFEDDETETQDQPILELVYGSIARLSALAAGQELTHPLRS